MDEQGMLQLVSFGVGNELFALSIKKIQEIIRQTEIVKIPRSPDFVEGVINLRGRIIPVIDLRKRFAVEAVDKTKQSRIIVAEIGEMVVGLGVDSVEEVVRIETSFLESTPSLVHGIDQRFVEGLVRYGENMLILLDVESLFSTDESEILKSVK